MLFRGFVNSLLIEQGGLMNKKDSEVDTVLSRMKQIFNVQRDADLSRAMGISPQTLSSWRQRSAIPYVLCVECAESKGASLNN